MSTLFRTQIKQQLSEIIASHMRELQTFFPVLANQFNVPTEWVDTIADLDQLTGSLPQYSTRQTREQILARLDAVQTYFNQMNFQPDDTFEETPIGRVWCRAQIWFEHAKRSRERVPINEVWELLKPAIPDSLEALDDGLYLAKWWKPVPVMDVEIVIRTGHILVHGDPYEPVDLPEGRAVCFSVI